MEPLYVLQGIVIQGKKRGKIFGFPTANIPLDKDVPEGIYASEVILMDKVYPAATFIGAAETYNENDKKVESYILDFNQDIYNKKITVKLYNKLRENKKFTSEQKLVEQIKKDVEGVKKYLQKNS